MGRPTSVACSAPVTSRWSAPCQSGFNSYIAFLPSPKPGAVASKAGVFVFANADGITETQTNDHTEVVSTIANDLPLIMQGQPPLVDKSVYPMADLLSRRRQA
jgi:hypothetical protein